MYISITYINGDALKTRRGAESPKDIPLYSVCDLDTFPTAQGKQAKKKGGGESLTGNMHGIWKFCQNTGSFVCSSAIFLILNINDIAIFAPKYPYYFLKLSVAFKVCFACETAQIN